MFVCFPCECETLPGEHSQGKLLQNIFKTLYLLSRKQDIEYVPLMNERHKKSVFQASLSLQVPVTLGENAAFSSDPEFCLQKNVSQQGQGCAEHY